LAGVADVIVDKPLDGDNVFIVAVESNVVIDAVVAGIGIVDKVGTLDELAVDERFFAGVVTLPIHELDAVRLKADV
jgi:hypothetical protein